MDNEIYSDIALEQNIRKLFGIHASIYKIIVKFIPVSHTAKATVFLTEKKELFVYIDGEARLTLGDVKKIIARMGLIAELFMPPKHHPAYFDDTAKERFNITFPGRTNPSKDDLLYYRTLAPYMPALVQINAVKNGEIYQYDNDSKSDWRLAVKFAYRRILTS